MNVSFSLKGRIIVSFRSNFEIFISFKVRVTVEVYFQFVFFFLRSNSFECWRHEMRLK